MKKYKFTIPLVIWSDQENIKELRHHSNISIYED